MSVATDPDRWFHGKITRENAAHLLSTGPGGRRDGLFLIRESLRMPGSFVLTLWARGQVHHFQILGHGDGWFSVDNGPLFQGLDELVRHYRVRPDGLPAQLHDFVVGATPPLAARKRLETDLHKAVVSKDAGTVRRALAAALPGPGSGVNSQSGDGSTPVHEAAKRGLCDILELLLACKPDFTVRDSKGSTALQLAARNGFHEAVRLLVERGGADVQERNATTGWVALHEAAFRGHVECSKTLLKLNAPLRPRTPDEDTPRELAARYKQRDVVELLDWAASNYPKARTSTAEWLHKAIDRSQAVQLLQKMGQADGSFLVRPNSRRPGYYALTLIYNQLPYHYEIVSESDHWHFIDDGP
jgi:tyrosine-protein kinase